MFLCLWHGKKVLLATCWKLCKYQFFLLGKKHCKYCDFCYQRHTVVLGFRGTNNVTSVFTVFFAPRVSKKNVKPQPIWQLPATWLAKKGYQCMSSFISSTLARNLMLEGPGVCLRYGWYSCKIVWRSGVSVNLGRNSCCIQPWWPASQQYTGWSMW